MPELYKLSREELEALMTKPRRPSKRRQAYEEIRNFLATIEPGEGGRIVLKEGENRLTVRNRLKRAAEELGVEIQFLRKRGGGIYFRVKEKEGEE